MTGVRSSSAAAQANSRASEILGELERLLAERQELVKRRDRLADETGEAAARIFIAIQHQLARQLSDIHRLLAALEAIAPPDSPPLV
jgi:hypothetical protein